LLETDTSATGKYFAERQEIDWVGHIPVALLRSVGAAE
jgi:hypothetical protein